MTSKILPSKPQDSANVSAARAEIRALEIAWNKQVDARDAEGFAMNYAVDGVQMNPAMPPLVGRETIRQFLLKLLADNRYVLNVVHEGLLIAESCDLAVSHGYSEVTGWDHPGTKGRTAHRASYVTVFRKQTDGEWKAALDIASPQSMRPEDVYAESRDATANADSRIETRADLERYLDCFNQRQYTQQVAYYAPDVRYSVGNLTLTSPGAIAEFYKEFHGFVKEHVSVLEFVKNGDTVAVALEARFDPFENYEKNGLSFKVGSPVHAVSLIFYKLSGGRIQSIRMGRYVGTPADFKAQSQGTL